MIADTVDKLYLMVRDVRESGSQHYQTCMRTFGDMKRNTGAKRIEERIEDLGTVLRRYIEPLKELIDPNAEPVQKITRLRKCMADLGANAAILGESVELDRKLVEKQTRKAAFDMDNQACLPVIRLIEQTNSGLEQEIVDRPISDYRR